MSGEDSLTIAQLGAIRGVVKEEIEAHYSEVAKKAVGWIFAMFISVIVGAFVFGSWVTSLMARVDSTERVFVSEVRQIKETLGELKADLKEREQK
jgi:hypothetical protein